MKKFYILIPVLALFIASCTKRDYVPSDISEQEWMRTHDYGAVAYVDFSTGNYIVETHNGFSVIESYSGTSPMEYDDLYAYFSSYGMQNIYNRTGRYFTKGRIVESWLSWSDALYILDELRFGGY